MIGDRRVLAVVPARSGSSGLKDKNMARLGGLTLIERAARVIAEVAAVDRALISTDSPSYAAHGSSAGLDAPFLRPPHLATSSATAVDVMADTLERIEAYDRVQYDIVLWVEPTSPLRVAEDLRACLRALVPSIDSVLTLSEIDLKCHPDKLLGIDNGTVRFLSEKAKTVANRQDLVGRPLIRDGLGYAVTRDCALGRKGFITSRTAAVLTARPVANIDTPLDLAWAEFLLAHEIAET